MKRKEYYKNWLRNVDHVRKSDSVSLKGNVKNNDLRHQDQDYVECLSMKFGTHKYYHWKYSAGHGCHFINKLKNKDVNLKIFGNLPEKGKRKHTQYVQTPWVKHSERSLKYYNNWLKSNEYRKYKENYEETSTGKGKSSENI